MKTDFICNVCGADHGRLIYQQKLPDLNYDANPTRLEELQIDYWLCGSCGSVTQFPPPTTDVISNYYKTVSTPLVEMVNYAEYKDRVFDDRFDFILEVTRLPSHSEVLEVGCANASFLTRFAENGFDVAGIEPSETASKIARDRYGAQIITGTIENLDITKLEDKFDLVLSMHTLEHVLNPQLFVSRIVKCIKPGGWLYLEVPDNSKVPGDSMLAWGDQISGVHITHFTSQGLILLLMKAGLSIHTMDSTGKFRYPSLRIFARKLSAEEDGSAAFKSAVDYQENIYRLAGERLLKIITENPDAVLWGAGSDLYQVVINTPELRKLKLVLVDRSPKKIGKNFLCYKVADPKEHKDANLIIATPASSLLRSSIEKDAAIQFPNATIERLFYDDATHRE